MITLERALHMLKQYVNGLNDLEKLNLTKVDD
jgi:hypothetical protein